jgi:Flp pilus assembly protein TadG
MLVPAAVLVLVILAAIAVDSAIVMLASRDVNNRAAAASNDIASIAIDDDAFYNQSGAIALRQAEADKFIDVAFSSSQPPKGYDRLVGHATVNGREVTVTAEADVRLLFARAIPGVRHVSTVKAAARATAAGG